MNAYRHVEWHDFKEQVIKLDGGRCVKCQRARMDGVVLQVHHKFYVLGKMPWEYRHSDCETLCKGCHAKEHGIIQPTTGWMLIGIDDLGDLIGQCEYCGTDLRYIHLVTHPKWPVMEIGTDCCDKLTGTDEASELHKDYLSAVDKRKRFISSRKWSNLVNGQWTIKHKGISVHILDKDGEFSISMNGHEGKSRFASLFDAKVHTFDAIDSGIAGEWLKKKADEELKQYFRQRQDQYRRYRCHENTR